MIALDMGDFGWNVVAVLVALGLRDVLGIGVRQWRRARRASMT